jgi:hypothetical protein
MRHIVLKIILSFLVSWPLFQFLNGYLNFELRPILKWLILSNHSYFRFNNYWNFWAWIGMDVFFRIYLIMYFSSLCLILFKRKHLNATWALFFMVFLIGFIYVQSYIYTLNHFENQIPSVLAEILSVVISSIALFVALKKIFLPLKAKVN